MIPKEVKVIWLLLLFVKALLCASAKRHGLTSQQKHNFESSLKVFLVLLNKILENYRLKCFEIKIDIKYMEDYQFPL